ncbi:BPL-N domain-containing protein [Tomitella gaofuii]|uniref:BPL-N domain-containing protein n=1 Tax=Tomitella gaofuii TaxID=2760083 RepID=UPI001F16E20C|nr:BPL-N domain-containing protein [Tomitella gaofuii]
MMFRQHSGFRQRSAFRHRRRGPLALVYRGAASSPCCPEAAAALVAASGYGFDVRFVGEHERLRLSPSVLADAALYVQPGGGSLGPAWKHLARHRETVRGFVDAGGSYLGLCLGAYLAGATPGFGLLPGDTDQYIRTRGAAVRDTHPHLVDVTWRGRPRSMYFQDGAEIIVDVPHTAGHEVLGRYPNGAIAALAADFGVGRVAVSGPHPEATRDWFIDDGLPPVSAAARAAGLDLIDAAMRTAAATRHHGTIA